MFSSRCGFDLLIFIGLMVAEPLSLMAADLDQPTGIKEIIIRNGLQSEYNFVESFDHQRMIIAEQIHIHVDRINPGEGQAMYDILVSGKVIFDGTRVYDITPSTFLFIASQPNDGFLNDLVKDGSRFRVVSAYKKNDLYHYEVAIPDTAEPIELKTKRQQLDQLQAFKQKKALERQRLRAEMMNLPQEAVDQIILDKLRFYDSTAEDVFLKSENQICRMFFKK